MHYPVYICSYPNFPNLKNGENLKNLPALDTPCDFCYHAPMKETPEYPIQEMSEPAREYLKVLKTNGNRRGRKVNGRNYPWARLEIGQSFIVEDAKLESIRSSALEAQRKLNRSFVCFQHAPFLPDYPFGVIEVIRIERRRDAKFTPYSYATDPHPGSYIPHIPGTPWPDYKEIDKINPPPGSYYDISTGKYRDIVTKEFVDA